MRVIAIVSDVDVAHVAWAVFVNFEDQIHDAWLFGKVRDGSHRGKKVAFFAIEAKHPAYIFGERIRAVVLTTIQFGFGLKPIRRDGGIPFVADFTNPVLLSFSDDKVQIDIGTIL